VAVVGKLSLFPLFPRFPLCLSLFLSLCLSPFLLDSLDSQLSIEVQEWMHILSHYEALPLLCVWFVCVHTHLDTKKRGNWKLKCVSHSK
jgi:hypothetical protein